jgi:hypothetical protein
MDLLRCDDMFESIMLGHMPTVRSIASDDEYVRILVL